MALRFLESFDHYQATADIYRKWTGVGANVSITPNGRNGQGCILGESLFITIDQQATWTIGFAVNFTAGPAFGNAVLYELFQVGGEPLAPSLCSIFINSDGTFSIRGNNHSQILANSTPGFSLQMNTWYFFELRVVLSSLANFMTVNASLRVNTATRATTSGPVTTGVNINSLLFPQATGNVHFWAGAGSGVTLDDIYINDGTGAYNNSFAGDVSIICFRPNGDVTTQWTPTGGGASFTQVNETYPNGGATNISDLTPGDVDNFDWQDLNPLIGSIVGLQYLVYAQKNNQGTRTIKMTIGPTGAFEQLSSEIFLDDSFVYYRLPTDVDPATGVPWTVVGFNAKRFGVELFA